MMEEISLYEHLLEKRNRLIQQDRLAETGKNRSRLATRLYVLNEGKKGNRVLRAN